jgi:hypothetical protein
MKDICCLLSGLSPTRGRREDQESGRFDLDRHTEELHYRGLPADLFSCFQVLRAAP